MEHESFLDYVSESGLRRTVRIVKRMTEARTRGNPHAVIGRIVLMETDFGEEVRKLQDDSAEVDIKIGDAWIRFRVAHD